MRHLRRHFDGGDSAFIEAFRKTFGVTPSRYFRDDERARTV
jgi:AraC-like DNA-binding protein